MPLLCSCHLEFITQPFTMGPRRILTRAKHLLFRDSLEARHERTAGALSEIFASFIIQDGMTSHRELEIVYDFARTVFPEVDHGILGRKLESAVARPQPIAPALRHLKKNLPAEHKTAFALQLYSVVRAGGDLEGERLRFTEVMEAIGPKKLGRAVIVELSQTNAPKSPLLTRVDFGRGSPNGVSGRSPPADCSRTPPS